jgi:hypothetical protein
MRRILATAVLLTAAAFPLAAANVKLYLKEGGYQLVREYQVQDDRVRFYSVERSQWEEIPADLVDLKRTQTEASARQEKLDRDAKSLTEEEEARKALQKEVLRIPKDAGVYWLEKDETHAIKAAESTVHTDKGRSALRIITGAQMISGKATLEIQGAHSLNVFTDPEQEFYIQVSEVEAFGIIKLAPKTGIRVVENLTTEPVTKMVDEEITQVEIIIQEMAKGGLYKIWAQQPLPPGEYAVVQYTLGKMNMQVWDFQIKAK